MSVEELKKINLIKLSFDFKKTFELQHQKISFIKH
jgi:hypothetical protein